MSLGSKDLSTEEDCKLIDTIINYDFNNNTAYSIAHSSMMPEIKIIGYDDFTNNYSYTSMDNAG